MSTASLEERSRNSARWAAYGDAMGFITELAESSLVARRSGQSRVTRLCAWERKVGGRMGALIKLPEGCYSDDTQLRLATSRAISDDGYFDVEAFAKIELPVWLSYALVAGRGTKAAAANLARRDVNWFSNFFKKKDSNYFNGGGNGAAMRIQPHVWSRATFADEEGLVLDVIRNAITTHGHPRGFLGSVFHALCLDLSLKHGYVAGPNEWREIIRKMRSVAHVFHVDSQLKSFWLPTWQDVNGASIEAASDKVLDELLETTELISSVIVQGGATVEEQYRRILHLAGGMEPSTRGSGTVTAVLSSALAWMFRKSPPHAAITLAVNELHSDTDTIATMAGAILGAVSSELPPERVLDEDYIEEDTSRLVSRCRRQGDFGFSYPDVAAWRAPKTLSDGIVEADGRLAVLGLGYVTPISEPIDAPGRNGQQWQWFKLEFGQTLLAKRQKRIRKVELTKDLFSAEADVETCDDSNKVSLDPIGSKEHDARAHLAGGSLGRRDQQVTWNVEELSTDAIKSGFDEATIGAHLLKLADSSSIELVVAYAAIIAKARISRNKHGKK